MTLWILKAKSPFTGWARLQNIVVRAETEHRARELAAYTASWNGDPMWHNPNNSSCGDGEEGVIIVDNNGG